MNIRLRRSFVMPVVLFHFIAFDAFASQVSYSPGRVTQYSALSGNNRVGNFVDPFLPFDPALGTLRSVTASLSYNFIYDVTASCRLNVSCFPNLGATVSQDVLIRFPALPIGRSI